jgi:predicted PurR-regulated permease PerM
MNPHSVDHIAGFFRRLQWGLLLLGVGWLIWMLAPVLTPFAAALLLAWLGDPVVDRLQKSGRSRNTAVVLVFTAMTLAMVGLVLGLIPLITDQIVVLAESVPNYLDWLTRTGLPWLQAKTGLPIDTWLDPDYLIEQLRRNWQSASGFLGQALGVFAQSSFTVLGWAANLVLIPFLTFFFLRDWDELLQRAAALVPRDQVDLVRRLARESDEVLGHFLRGQFLVMLSMGIFYALGLWLVGLEVGVLIGIIAGILTFVPYLGPTTVLLGGITAALVQFGDWQHVVGVLAVFGIGQLLESYVLTPKLVGDRVGLSPVTVVFSVMAGGTLFGFLGMLLALPVASVANVLIRHALSGYTASRFYRGHGGDVVDAPEEVAAAVAGAIDERLGAAPSQPEPAAAFTDGADAAAANRTSP